MLNNIFLAISLSGANWVLYVLVALSIFSIALIVERFVFYKKASQGLVSFRQDVRLSVQKGDYTHALAMAEQSMNGNFKAFPNLESELCVVLLSQSTNTHYESLEELSKDALLRAKLAWDKNLSILATIGSNAPFIGLFGTVLGIIQAFHDLSNQAQTSSMHTVTSGISEALVATAVGILVAIPATIAYNLYLRKVKAATQNAESMKSFLIGKKLST